MNRSDFQKLARLRIKEAKILLDHACYEGAYYLTGYAVECALKACIAKKTNRFEFPPKPEFVRDLYKHDLVHLVKMAGLESDLKSEMVSVVEFRAYWGTVKDWSEQVRYETAIDARRANDIYLAVADKKHGVLTWLKKYW